MFLEYISCYYLFYLFIFQGKKVKMIVVGVGFGIDYNELNEIVNGKVENVIYVDKFEDFFVRLNNVF